MIVEKWFLMPIIKNIIVDKSNDQNYDIQHIQKKPLSLSQIIYGTKKYMEETIIEWYNNTNNMIKKIWFRKKKAPVSAPANQP